MHGRSLARCPECRRLSPCRRPRALTGGHCPARSPRRRTADDAEARSLRATASRSSAERVYAWAGELRTVDIAKPGAFFCPAHRITGYAREVFRRIEHGPAVAELTPDDVIDRLPRHLADVNALHPFREGNGRAQRAFFTQWAAQGGVTLDWSRMTLERNIATSTASFRGDLQPLRDLVADIATPADRQDR